MIATPVSSDARQLVLRLSSDLWTIALLFIILGFLMTGVGILMGFVLIPDSDAEMLPVMLTFAVIGVALGIAGVGLMRNSRNAVGTMVFNLAEGRCEITSRDGLSAIQLPINILARVRTAMRKEASGSRNNSSSTQTYYDVVFDFTDGSEFIISSYKKLPNAEKLANQIRTALDGAKLDTSTPVGQLPPHYAVYPETTGGLRVEWKDRPHILIGTYSIMLLVFGIAFTGVWIVGYLEALHGVIISTIFLGFGSVMGYVWIYLKGHTHTVSINNQEVVYCKKRRGAFSPKVYKLEAAQFGGFLFRSGANPGQAKLFLLSSAETQDLQKLYAETTTPPLEHKREVLALLNPEKALPVPSMQLIEMLQVWRGLNQAEQKMGLMQTVNQEY